MKTEIIKFEKIPSGWDISFKVEFNDNEALNCDLNPLEHIGDYEIKHDANILTFSCAFQKEELYANETIEERLTLIEKDIKNIAGSCLS
jgi:hypothetical protein